MTGEIYVSGPALPSHGDAFEFVGVQTGMSRRDYFAAAALTGICANSYTPWSPNVADIDDSQIAKAALDLADALIAASKEADHA